MDEEEQPSSSKSNKVTPITRAWRIGGPMTAAQRKKSKELFLEMLKVDPNVSAACDYAQISRKTAYEWRGQDETFADGWESALDQTKDFARSSIYQRGIIGWDELVVSQGQVVFELEPAKDEGGNQIYERGKPMMRRGNIVTIHKWSDSLAALYARANLPEYKDKQTIDLNAQITTMADQAKDELLADLAAAMAHENKESPDQE